MDNSLKAIWDKSDEYYIRMRDAEDRTPAAAPVHVKKDNSKSSFESEDEYVDAYLSLDDNGYNTDESQDKYNSETFGDYDAIPEEFRPDKQGRDLLQISSSWEQRHHREVKSSGQENQVERTNEMWQEDISSVQNKKGDLKASKPNSDIKTPTEKTNKQKNVDTIFYYSSYFGNLEEDEETVEKREIFKAKFSENSTCKAVNKKTTFKFDPPEPSSRPSRRVDSRPRQFPPVKIKPETGVKCEKLPPVTQKKTFNQRNRHYFRQNGFQKVTSEVTVEKRINWDPELCKPGRHSSRPEFSVKCTSKIDNYYLLNNNSKVGAKKKFPNQFREANNLVNSNYRTNQVKHKNQNVKDDKYHSQTNRMHSDSFAEKTPQTNYGARKKTYHPNINNRNVPVVRHEIRVIHVNEPGPSSEVCRDCRHANPPNRVEKILPHGQNKRMTQKSNHEIQNSAVINRSSGKHTDETDDMCEKLENLSLNSSALRPRTDASVAIFDISSMENGPLLLRFGTEMSEMIAGSHVAMNAFLGVYNEWIDLRRVTMLLFEELEKNLSDSGNRNKRIKDVLQYLGTGAKIVRFVPDKRVAIVGQVIGAIIDFVSKLFSPTAMKSIGLDNLDDFQLRLALQQDIEATGDIYVHCLQCDQQFQETCKLIEQFYQKIQNGYFNEFKEIFETNFLKEMSQFSPQNPDVFYKRLKTCYKRLQENQVSGLGEAFCKAFEDWPDVMTTISRLHRRFNSEMWDDMAVVKAWQEIYQLLQDENSIVSDVIDKVHNCILVLISQRSIMDKYAMDLQKQI